MQLHKDLQHFAPLCMCVCSVFNTILQNFDYILTPLSKGARLSALCTISSVSHKFKWVCCLCLEASHFKCIQLTACRTTVFLDMLVFCACLSKYGIGIIPLYFLGGGIRLIMVLVIHPSLNNVRVQSTMSQSLAIAAWREGKGLMFGEILHNR